MGSLDIDDLQPDIDGGDVGVLGVQRHLAGNAGEGLSQLLLGEELGVGRVGGQVVEADVAVLAAVGEADVLGDGEPAGCWSTATPRIAQEVVTAGCL